MKTKLLALMLLPALATADAEPLQITEASCAAFMHRYYDRADVDSPSTQSERQLWLTCTDKFESALDLAEDLIMQIMVKKKRCSSGQSLHDCAKSL